MLRSDNETRPTEFAAAPRRVRNLACLSDADCEVVSTGCHTYAHGVCGQAQVSRSAAASARWKMIQDDLDDGGITGCAQCDAALNPHCVEGSCGGKP